MRRGAAGLLAAVILLGAAAAVGGNSSDTLISQSYLTETYLPETVREAHKRVQEGLKRTYDDASARLKARAELYLARAGALAGEGGDAASFAEQRFKRGDILTIDTGSSIQLLAGSAAADCASGSLVDVTAGQELPAGGNLTAVHRYLAAEGTLCRITVTSDTAVLAPQGYYALTKSGEVDYNALANGLKAMGMFKGSDVGFGSGYELERAPTRIEGLILFLRMLGEEEAALAYGDRPCPFADVGAWSRGYVTYAYEKGYTKGVGADSGELSFRPDGAISAREYMTFVLRALGYRDEGDTPDFTWETALTRALQLGSITAGEHKLFTEQPFLRAQVAYLSYYALDAQRKAGGSLQSYLVSTGAMDAARVASVRAGVQVTRLA